MYNNIGRKIKGLAKAIFFIEAIAAIVCGCALFVDGLDGSIILIALLVMVGGSIVAWISSWLLYGYGEMIEKNCLIEKHLQDLLTISQSNTPSDIDPTQTSKKVVFKS